MLSSVRSHLGYPATLQLPGHSGLRILSCHLKPRDSAPLRYSARQIKSVAGCRGLSGVVRGQTYQVVNADSTAAALHSDNLRLAADSIALIRAAGAVIVKEAVVASAVGEDILAVEDAQAPALGVGNIGVVVTDCIGGVPGSVEPRLIL